MSKGKKYMTKIESLLADESAKVSDLRAQLTAKDQEIARLREALEKIDTAVAIELDIYGSETLQALVVGIRDLTRAALAQEG